jgi:hypothetical protein
MCGQLRLSAALALLRLARRHDTRLNPSTYSSLALMMQDESEGVRAAFAAKVYRLMRFFLVSVWDGGVSWGRFSSRGGVGLGAAWVEERHRVS